MAPTRRSRPKSLAQLPCLALVAASTLVLINCGGDEAPVTEERDVAALSSADNGDNPLAALYGATEIPYPVYPNGKKYRVGGENGLKIVVFETEDSFDTVDAFYQDLSQQAGMPRLMAMNDYVRYSQSSADEDPWATYRPGIVIHEFSDDSERQALGAKKNARTNIIMSF